jgi:hypothetical protein
MFNLTMTDREKKLFLIMVVLVVGAAGYYGIYTPVKNLMAAPDSTAQLEERIQELNTIYQIYEKSRDEKNKLERLLNSRNDNTTTNITKWAAENDLSGNIAYTRRTQTNIQNKYVRTNTDIKINGAPIQSLIGFVHSIENSDDLIFITYVSFTKGLKSRKTYDALIKIHSYSVR